MKLLKQLIGASIFIYISVHAAAQSPQATIQLPQAAKPEQKSAPAKNPNRNDR